MKKLSRKEFLSYTALAGATVTLGSVVPSLTSCGGAPKTENALTSRKGFENAYYPVLDDKAIEGTALRAGVIGCGGRGTGAASDFLNSADNVTITALCDLFPDRVEGAKKSLKDNHNLDIPAENCYVGFDGYKQLIDSGVVDVVIVATPPCFRPEHFRYAVEKGKHSFLEKPIAVDANGYRTILAASKQAKAKGLCCVTGTQRHHQRSYVESFKKINEGIIGEITGGAVYWNQSMLWYRTKEKSWTDMEWMVRDWVNWTWLSGDHIVEQHVHNIDVFTWFSGLKPVKATAFGSRQRRITGDQYDNFSVDFEFENGIHMHSMCRQIDGTSSNVSEFIQGTKGSWNSADMTIKDLAGNVVWQFDGKAESEKYKQTNPYVLEHGNLISHIRKGEVLCQAEETALSNMAAIMGRTSAYTGQTVTWDEMTAAQQNLIPEVLEIKNMDMSVYKVPVPGEGKA